MNRRDWMIVAGLTAASLIGASVPLSRYFESDKAKEARISEKLKRFFDCELPISDSAIEQFVADMKTNKHQAWRKYYEINSSELGDLAAQFLMSSDYFFQTRQSKEMVRYRFYYDPERTPCSNPFAEFGFED